MRPLFYLRWEKIAHYYGDNVRVIFLILAALMLFGAPFYSSALTVEMPFVVIGAFVLVCLAALTSPHSRIVMTANVVAAGVGVVMYGGWSLFGYQTGTPVDFILREAVAFTFLLSLYFSLKTLRAMHMNQIGKEPSGGDFNDPDNERVNFVEEAEEDTAAISLPEDGALDGLGNPAAPDVDKGD